MSINNNRPNANNNNNRNNPKIQSSVTPIIVPKKSSQNKITDETLLSVGEKFTPEAVAKRERTKEKKRREKEQYEKNRTELGLPNTK